MIKPKIYQMSCISMYHDAIFDMEVCLCLCESHLHFVTVEEVNVWFVLFVVLTDEQKDRRVSCLVQQSLTVMNCGQRKVFKLFLRETKRNKEKQRSGVLDLQNELQFYLILNGLQKKINI